MTQNIDDMTFGEAFAHARAHNWRLLSWRGEGYHIDLSADVARGFQRQAQIEREHMAKTENPDFAELDAPEQAWSTIEEARNNTFPDEEYPPAGRMTTDKPVDLLRIERQANGGWLVDGRKDVRDDYMTRSDVSAAFTNTADMLRALEDLLHQDDAKRGEKADG